jgi:hypothetical protein
MSTYDQPSVDTREEHDEKPRCQCGEEATTTYDREPICWGCLDDMAPAYEDPRDLK